MKKKNRSRNSVIRPAVDGDTKAQRKTSDFRLIKHCHEEDSLTAALSAIWC